MSNGNGTTAKWISIIIAIVITFSGIAFGVVRTSNRDRIVDLQNRISQHEKEIQQMKEAEIRLDMRLLNIEKQTASIDKKVDILLERGRNDK